MLFPSWRTSHGNHRKALFSLLLRSPRILAVYLGHSVSMRLRVSQCAIPTQGPCSLTWPKNREPQQVSPPGHPADAKSQEMFTGLHQSSRAFWTLEGSSLNGIWSPKCYSHILSDSPSVTVAQPHRPSSSPSEPQHPRPPRPGAGTASASTGRETCMDSGYVWRQKWSVVATNMALVRVLSRREPSSLV